LKNKIEDDNFDLERIGLNFRSQREKENLRLEDYSKFNFPSKTQLVRFEQGKSKSVHVNTISSMTHYGLDLNLIFGGKTYQSRNQKSSFKKIQILILSYSEALDVSEELNAIFADFGLTSHLYCLDHSPINKPKVFEEIDMVNIAEICIIIVSQSFNSVRMRSFEKYACQSFNTILYCVLNSGLKHCRHMIKADIIGKTMFNASVDLHKMIYEAIKNTSYFSFLDHETKRSLWSKIDGTLKNNNSEWYPDFRKRCSNISTAAKQRVLFIAEGEPKELQCDITNLPSDKMYQDHVYFDINAIKSEGDKTKLLKKHSEVRSLFRSNLLTVLNEEYRHYKIVSDIRVGRQIMKEVKQLGHEINALPSFMDVPAELLFDNINKDNIPVNSNECSPTILGRTDTFIRFVKDILLNLEGMIIIGGDFYTLSWCEAAATISKEYKHIPMLVFPCLGGVSSDEHLHRYYKQHPITCQKCLDNKKHKEIAEQGCSKENLKNCLKWLLNEETAI
jgi:hypothetical protein